MLSPVPGRGIIVEDEEDSTLISCSIDISSDETGKVSGTVNVKTLLEMAEKTKEISAEKKAIIELKMELDEQDAGVMLSIPAEGWNEVADNTNAGIRIATGNADITFDNRAVKAIEITRKDQLEI